MKTLIAATLLAMTSPALAAKADPHDFRLLLAWRHQDFQCYRGVFPDKDDVDVEMTKEEYARTARGKACLAAAMLLKKLNAKGYCTFDNGGIGRSRDGRCDGVSNLPVN